MRVTVLFGGPSAERPVSLVSGGAVIEALKQAGHDVFPSDVSPTDLSGLDHPADVVFPVLHGQFGESGELQEILERRNIAFVGSGSVASRTGMDKVASKKIWQKAGLPTPAWSVVDTATATSPVPGTCVVKPINSGSSIDVFVCKAPAECDAQATAAIASVVAKHGKALVEQFIHGTELTVGILEERALSPIRITTTHEFFDFKAKYVGNDAQHHFNLKLPAEVVKEVQSIALRAHRVLGCRDLSRVDFIVDQENRPWILEINTIPGFTPKSLLPEAAGHDGIGFKELVDRLVRRAFERGAAKVSSSAA
jgi:D-alanine-D-alanine ligase